MSRQIIWIILFIIGIILLIGIIIALINFAIGFLSSPRPVAPVVPTPTPIALVPLPTSPPVITPTPVPINIPPSPPPLQTTVIVSKVYAGPGFILNYPANWGILTCRNSQNFEFDPLSGVDQLSVVCTVAQKPITIILDNDLQGCSGTRVNIGGVSVLKSTTTGPNFTQHLWCTNTSPILKITNRVGATGYPATSPIDYTPEIENMIASLRFTAIAAVF